MITGRHSQCFGLKDFPALRITCNFSYKIGLIHNQFNKDMAVQCGIPSTYNGRKLFFTSLYWEALFLFCLPKVLSPTIFGLRQLKLSMLELPLALLLEQLLAHLEQLMGSKCLQQLGQNSLQQQCFFLLSGAQNCWPNSFVPTIGEKV